MTEERRRGRLMTAIRLALYPAFEPPDRKRLQSLTIDAQNSRIAGNFSKAEQLYLTVIREAEGRPHLASDLDSSRSGLALVYKAQGRYAESESIYLGQLAQAKGTPQPNTLLHAAYISLAELYQDEGRYAEAERYYKAALAETEKPDLWPNWGPLVCTSTRVAQFYVSRKNYPAAEALFKRAIQILEIEEPRLDSSLPHHLNELAKFYQDQGKHAEAEESYRRAVAASEKYRGPGDTLTVHYLYHLGAYYLATGRHSDAEAIYRRALATVEKAAALETARYKTPWKRLTLKRSYREGVIRNIESLVGNALDHLAECYESQHKYAEAEPLRRRSLEITERGWGKIVPHRLAEALETYADLLRKLGRDAEAEQVESRARPVRTKYPKGSCRRQFQISTRLGGISLWWRLSTFMRVLIHPSNFR
jgi:tetratricopeptide (TPR) repeat protein